MAEKKASEKIIFPDAPDIDPADNQTEPTGRNLSKNFDHFARELEALRAITEARRPDQ